MEANSRTGHRWLSWVICLSLAVAVGMVFGQTLGHSFINFDDNTYIYENAVVAQGLTWHGIVWALSYGEIGHWHPVTWFSHMLDCQLYGLHPGGHHLTNVLLHAANAILLFLILQELTGAFWRSAFVAGVFAIHPLRVESVAWVAERKDVLSGFFFMLTLWFYVRYARKQAVGSKGPKTFDYSLALFFFACGLMSKSMLVTLPFVLLLLDRWPLNRVAGWGRLVLEKVPFLAFSAASCIATMLVPEKVATGEQWPFSMRLGNGLTSYVTYVWQMLWPAKLAVPCLYSANGVSLGKEAGALALLVAISLAAIACWRKRPYLAVGWLWYVGMLVPVIGVVQISYYAHADRYTYLPQIGLYIMVAWGAVELCGSWRYSRIALGFVAGVIIASLMAAAYVQTGYWKDSVSLWRHTLACAPGNYIAHNNLGNVLAEQRNLPEAVQQYEQAIQYSPYYTDAHNNLGVALGREGKLPEAVQQYEQALQLDPNYAKAHNNLGNILSRNGKLPEAVQQYQRALQLNPDYLEAHYNLANVLVAQGKLDEAARHYQQALHLAEALNRPALVESIRAALADSQPPLSKPQSP